MVSSHLDSGDTTTPDVATPDTGKSATTGAEPAEPGTTQQVAKPDPAAEPTPSETRHDTGSGDGHDGRPGRADRAWSVVIDGLPYDPTTPRGWLATAAGLGGTLLIATSYLASWLTATLEHRDGVDSHAMALHEVTTTPLAWMYRIATLAMIACAVALVYAPRSVARSPLRVVGFTGAALSLYSALVATYVITNVGGALSGAMTVRYGVGLYAGYLGIVAVACFIGLVGRRDAVGPAATR
jgi:hypothetical protein